MAISWSTSTVPTGAFVSNCVWASSLNLFVAVGSTTASSNQNIWTSPDGITWTARTSPRTDTTGWSSIGWNGTTLVAISQNTGSTSNRVATSTDGITWTGHSIPDTTQQPIDIAWSPTLSLWAVVSTVSGTNKVLTSPDGATWTNRTGVNGHAWSNIQWSPSLALFVAVHESTPTSTTAIMTSSDGLTWTAQTTPATGVKYLAVRALCWSPGLSMFVAPGTGDSGSTYKTVLTSTNATSWSQSNSFPSGGSNPTTWVSVVWDDVHNQFIASGVDGTTQIATSPDGVTWTSQDPGTHLAWISGTWASSLGTVLFFDLNSNTVLVGANPTPWWKVTLPDFELWIQSLTQPANFVMNWDVFSNGQFYPSGSSFAWALTGTTPSNQGWFFSLNNYSGAAYLVNNTSRPAVPRGFADITTFANGSAGVFGGFPGIAAPFNNKMIYAQGTYTGAPPIRSFDGLFDEPIAYVSNTSAGVTPVGIVSMIAANGQIYYATFDTGTDNTSWVGRVFSLDPKSGQAVQLGNPLTTGHLPYALCWHAGRLWCGTNRQDSTHSGKIFFIRPGIDKDWTADYDLSTSSMAGCTSLASFQGQLYVGTSAASGTFATVLVRSTAGAYTTSLTLSGGTAQANNAVLSMLVFGGNLYVGFWNPDTPNVSSVRKYTGSAWSSVYTDTRPIIQLGSDLTTMFGLIGGVGKAPGLVTTPDGTTWTDETVFLPTTTSTGLPAFCAVVH